MVGNLYSIALNIPCQVEIECITDCKLFKINYRDLENELLKEARTSKVFVQYTLKFMMNVFDHVDQLTLLNKEDRYRWLENNKKQLLLDLPDKYIASYLGLSTASLSRIKRKYYSKRKC